MRTSNLSRKIYWGFLITCLIFIIYGLISQIIYGERIFEFLKEFRRNIFLGICFINISYLVRYFRWRYLVYKIGFKPSFKKDFINWLSSFAFSTTPGKIGELIRIDFYNKDFNIPKSKTLIILIIEKISDLVSIFMISFLSFYCFSTIYNKKKYKPTSRTRIHLILYRLKLIGLQDFQKSFQNHTLH